MDLTRCNPCTLLVVPTFVARATTHTVTPDILQTICREGCAVILQKRPLPRHIGICFWISRHVLLPFVPQKSSGPKLFVLNWNSRDVQLTS